MKAKINNETITKIIQEEASKLRDEMMASKEEKRLQYISERKQEIESLINEIYEEDKVGMDELFGIGSPKTPEQIKAKYAKLQKQYDAKYWRAHEKARAEAAEHGPDHELALMKWAIKNPNTHLYYYDPEKMMGVETGIKKMSGFGGDMLGGPTSSNMRLEGDEE